jgi:hypothetical protein
MIEFINQRIPQENVPAKKNAGQSWWTERLEVVGWGREKLLNFIVSS